MWISILKYIYNVLLSDIYKNPIKLNCTMPIIVCKLIFTIYSMTVYGKNLCIYYHRACILHISS